MTDKNAQQALEALANEKLLSIWRQHFGGVPGQLTIIKLREVVAACSATLESAAPSAAEPVALPKVDLRKIAEEAGICMDLWDMGAASLAHSEGCEGVTRADLERFAALYGFACWKAALVANPPNMQGMVDRALDSFLSARPPAPEEGKDAALLDWFEQNHRRVSFAAGLLHGPSSWSFFDAAGVCHTGHESARTAIEAAIASDAAMAQGERG